MKRIVTFLLLISALLLCSCGECKHRDRDYNGICDDCAAVLCKVSAEEWKSAFGFTNATIKTLELVDSAENMGDVNEYFIVDGDAYDETGKNLYSVSALASYFAFADSYESFVFDESAAKYVCEQITVENVTYKNVFVSFNASKNLNTIEFSVDIDASTAISCTVTVSAHGTTEIPGKQP